MKAAARLRQHLANDFDVTEHGTRINIDTHRHTINVRVKRGDRTELEYLDLTVEQFANILMSGDHDRHTVPVSRAEHQEALDALESALAIRTAERDQLAEKLERLRTVNDQLAEKLERLWDVSVLSLPRIEVSRDGKTLVEVFSNERRD